MSLLYWFESIRNPILDKIMLLLTEFGDETLFLVIAVIFFWCVNKKTGYFLFLTCFAGTVINQFLKISVRIERPWILDANFKPVADAVHEGLGYSFPSGHTQTAVGLYAGLALREKNKVFKTICIIIAAVVPITRMYLGVHTPLDVFTSVGIATVLILVLNILVDKVYKNKSLMWWIIGVLTLLTVAFTIYVGFLNMPDNINWVSANENAYKMLGCFVGLVGVWVVDNKISDFDTDAVLWVQAVKTVSGLLIIFSIKTFLKQPMYFVFGENAVADGVRYFLMVIFAGAVWPLTFKFFKRIGERK